MTCKTEALLVTKYIRTRKVLANSVLLQCPCIEFPIIVKNSYAWLRNITWPRLLKLSFQLKGYEALIPRPSSLRLCFIARHLILLFSCFFKCFVTKINKCSLVTLLPTISYVRRMSILDSFCDCKGFLNISSGEGPLTSYTKPSSKNINSEEWQWRSLKLSWWPV